ncbi:exported hypothetical protein [Actinacidiphila bryophytorum]|uniref:Uncharacterized protein n=1 Tax=Actinacidiphila bryophytorum TaxID=1436133 RepID=A0A9W4MIA6_9ACTN|nr:exported hypothetical protein [Actinacidiphila bryophytorum]
MFVITQHPFAILGVCLKRLLCLLFGPQPGADTGAATSRKWPRSSPRWPPPTSSPTW